ncbi:MAG: discoidin domain-containing protein [Draconibacterium sp.]|nr:discoidin domain-containing protein [Draconibacterium sp.]
MKHFILIVNFICIAVLYASAQNQYSSYDELPGIDKIYKPAFEPSFSGWKKMLYEYPINFIEIEADFISYSKQNPNEKSAIIRYYKIWRRAVEPFVNSTGVILIPNLKAISEKQLLAQKNAGKNQKSASFTNSDWSFLGPKETFWRNGENINPDRIDANGDPKQCPWQANVYSFDVANSDNNILYCGTETGFVNKSTDKGLTWDQLGKNYPFGGSVPAIAIHHINANIIYVAAGNQIHKSTNGGETWTPLLATDKQFKASRLKIDTEDNNIIVAAASSGLYISKDAGNSWIKKWSSPVWDVEFNPKNDSLIYALSRSLSGKYRFIVSRDLGESFQYSSNFPDSYEESSGGLLAVTPANSRIMYATLLAKEGEELVPFILKGTETDGVFTWEETKKGEYHSTGGLGGFTNGQGYFDLVMEVSPNDENLVFWGTCSLWKSADGGKNYARVGGYGGDFPIHPDIQDMKIMPNGDTWVSTDGGMNFSTDYFTDINNYSSRTKGIIGSDMWGFDQGWNEDIVVGGRYHNGNTALAEFYNDKALRMGGAESPTGWVIKGKSRHVAYSDLGNGWILPKMAEDVAEGRFIFSKYPNMDEYGGRRSNLVQHPNYYGTIYVGEGNGIWESNDTGESFNLLFQFPGKIRYFQISHKNPDVLYADIVGNGLYKSEDGGLSWEQKPSLTNGSNGDSSWNGNLFFTISPYDENKIYVCLQNGTWSTDIGKIFRSLDEGNTWTDWTDGVSEYTKCLLIQPSNNGKDIVYLFTTSKNGNNAKVYSRIEGQPDWNSFDDNYPVGMSVNLALPFYRDSKIRVAGNGGVWESPMLETNFTPIINPWVEKSMYNCMEDTLFFDDHSILNHANASWEWHISPEPSYMSNANVRNPKVVLGNPGLYDVTLTVTQRGETYSKTIPEMVSTTTCPSISDCDNPAELDKENWSLIYADSEETDAANRSAGKAFDGDPDSFWHTQWYYYKPGQPHEIQIDLGKKYLLSSFTYLPRQNSSNGRIKDYEFYVSNDKLHWGNTVSKGTFESGAGSKKVLFDATNGRYIKFESLSEQNGNSFTTVAELSLFGCIESNNTANTIFETGDIKAYPIPAVDKITVDLPQNNKSGRWKYEIISSAGSTIETNTFFSNSSNYTFSLQKIKPGLYFIQLKNGDSSTYRIKFIKN